MGGDKESVSLNQVTCGNKIRGTCARVFACDISSLITFQSRDLAVGRLTRIVGDAGWDMLSGAFPCYQPSIANLSLKKKKNTHFINNFNSSLSSFICKCQQLLLNQKTEMHPSENIESIHLRTCLQTVFTIYLKVWIVYIYKSQKSEHSLNYLMKTDILYGCIYGYSSSWSRAIKIYPWTYSMNHVCFHWSSSWMRCPVANG